MGLRQDVRLMLIDAAAAAVRRARTLRQQQARCPWPFFRPSLHLSLSIACINPVS
jgi:hypothetical protein